MKTPARMTDLRHVETSLSAEDIRDALHENQRMRMKDMLGNRYLLSLANAPQKGAYNERGLPVAA